MNTVQTYLELINGGVTTMDGGQIIAVTQTVVEAIEASTDPMEVGRQARVESASGITELTTTVNGSISSELPTVNGSSTSESSSMVNGYSSSESSSMVDGSNSSESSSMVSDSNSMNGR